ncbi:beta-ureidopropionase [Sporolactobacillus inulinus]|uniref:Beta-ureidopropionase n=1 Tax=Sporolactobacillus inulinus TaxID=2078 RepID=A0A4Y1ZB12_9BACL|nr:beta-ureidopropionase [Sporolactobacillus inulinus]
MVDTQRVKQTMRVLAQIGRTDRGMMRLAYSKAEEQATNVLIEQCQAAGLAVRVDSVGNVIARRQGRRPELPAIGIGSHLDTVYEGGTYDGTLGVLAALEVMRDLNARGIETMRPIELFPLPARSRRDSASRKSAAKRLPASLSKRTLPRSPIKKGRRFKRFLPSAALTSASSRRHGCQEIDWQLFWNCILSKDQCLRRKIGRSAW